MNRLIVHSCAALSSLGMNELLYCTDKAVLVLVHIFLEKSIYLQQYYMKLKYKSHFFIITYISREVNISTVLYAAQI